MEVIHCGSFEGALREVSEKVNKEKENPGDNGGGVTPVSIPNTEVKSSSADGTAYSFCGRVGHCRDFSLLIFKFSCIFCSAVRVPDSFFIYGEIFRSLHYI